MLTHWYITGFCDGAATFTFSRMHGTYNLYFVIRQKEDNRQIVEDVNEYFHGVGSLYAGKGPLSAKNSGLSKASVYYRVNKIQELKIIIDHFDKYPLQSKKKLEAYQAWREMVLHKLENYRNINYDKLRGLAEKLSKLNSKSRAFSRKTIKD